MHPQLFPAPPPGATVLLIEDDTAVLGLLAQHLRRRGFVVLEARDVNEARRQAADYPGRLDLVLTDAVMPGLPGPTLARELLKTRPNARVICMSGDLNDRVLHAPGSEIVSAFIEKPFELDEMEALVRLVLG